MKRCSNCNVYIHDGMMMCPECGYVFEEEDPNLSFFEAG